MSRKEDKMTTVVGWDLGGANLKLACIEGRRAVAARLMTDAKSASGRPIREALKEFLLHGVKYAFPPERGELTRGPRDERPTQDDDAEGCEGGEPPHVPTRTTKVAAPSASVSARASPMSARRSTSSPETAPSARAGIKAKASASRPLPTSRIRAAPAATENPSPVVVAGTTADAVTTWLRTIGFDRVSVPTASARVACAGTE